MSQHTCAELGARSVDCVVSAGLYKSLSFSFVAFGNKHDLVNSILPVIMSPIGRVSTQAIGSEFQLSL